MPQLTPATRSDSPDNSGLSNKHSLASRAMTPSRGFIAWSLVLICIIVQVACGQLLVGLAPIDLKAEACAMLKFELVGVNDAANDEIGIDGVWRILPWVAGSKIDWINKSIIRHQGVSEMMRLGAIADDIGILTGLISHSIQFIVVHRFFHLRMNIHTGRSAEILKHHIGMKRLVLILAFYRNGERIFGPEIEQPYPWPLAIMKGLNSSIGSISSGFSGFLLIVQQGLSFRDCIAHGPNLLVGVMRIERGGSEGPASEKSQKDTHYKFRGWILIFSAFLVVAAFGGMLIGLGHAETLGVARSLALCLASILAFDGAFLLIWSASVASL